MNTQLLRRVRSMFNNPLISIEENREYQRQWVQKIRYLGDKWILAKPVDKERRVSNCLIYKQTVNH